MARPPLNTLPMAPENRTGWPWTEESSPSPDQLPDGRQWPRISIVTPSYNQGPFIEETIRSILLQGYPNLEYFIVDGGSTDESVAIIRKYEAWLTGWVSEPDSGQAAAINKGFAAATGAIYGWLNSDDLYEPDALHIVGEYLSRHPECDLVYGNGWYANANGDKLAPCRWVQPFDRRLLLTVDLILQPAAFWRSTLWEQTSGLNISYQWGLDWDWFIRATKLTRPYYLTQDLARWRIRPEIKSLAGGMACRSEIAAISRLHGGIFQPTHLIYQCDCLAEWMTRHFGRGPVGRFPQYPLTVLRIALRKVFTGRYSDGGMEGYS